MPMVGTLSSSAPAPPRRGRKRCGSGTVTMAQPPRDPVERGAVFLDWAALMTWVTVMSSL